MNKTIASLFVLLTGIPAAHAVTGELRSSYSSGFYLALFGVVVILAAIVFLMWKLRYRWKQVIKAVGISLLITIALEAVIFVLGTSFRWWMVWCKGFKCSSQFEIFMVHAPYTAGAFFLVVLLVYCVVALLKSRVFIQRRKDR